MQKKTLIIILCVVIVILVAIVGVYIATSKKSEINSKEVVQSNLVGVKPNIEYSISPENETDGDVVIVLNAQIDGDYTIKSIILPNGEKVYKDNAAYTVTKNGDYTFIVESSNGESVEETVTVDNINKSSADNPYIPNGFSKVENQGTGKETIIEDEYGNQFVWVPVESGNLIRNTSNNSQYKEEDYTASGLYNSVAKYYGFYIARYESGKYEENGVIAAKSVANEVPWSNVSYEDAYNACLNAANVYGYSGVKTALVNSYAWDTTLNWLDKTTPNYSASTSYSGNGQEIILKTGTNDIDQVNSICDMAGNLREWTTEVFYPNTTSTIEEDTSEIEEDVTYRVIRGGSTNINKTATSHIGQPENMSDIYWGFRMIMYKD